MMKQFRFRTLLYSLISILLASSCLDNEALRGKVSIALTDSPIDGSNIKKVTLAIRNVEALPNGGQQWQTIKSFEEPKTVNIMDYSLGKTFDLTEQLLPPGKFEAIRLELNIASVNNGLTVFPQSTIGFSDGTQKILIVDGSSNYIESKFPFSITTNQTTFITLDVDLRKSIILTPEGYKILPNMRAVNPGACGGVEGQFRDFANFQKVVAYAYASGSFSNSEITTSVPFLNAISSSTVQSNNGGHFLAAFLPEGGYDLVFVDHHPDGTISKVIGTYNLPADKAVLRGKNSFVSVFAKDLQ